MARAIQSVSAQSSSRTRGSSRQQGFIKPAAGILLGGAAPADGRSLVGDGCRGKLLRQAMARGAGAHQKRGGSSPPKRAAAPLSAHAIHVVAVAFGFHQTVDIGLETTELGVEFARELPVAHDSAVEAFAASGRARFPASFALRAIIGSIVATDNDEDKHDENNSYVQRSPGRRFA